jgi:hypothetical protein
MGKADFKTGALLEIPLEKEYGYGYAKLIFSEDIQPNLINLPIIKVYNRFSKERINESEFDRIIFESDDLVMYPLLMIGYPTFRGKLKWIIKRNSELTAEDKVIPDYLKIEMKRSFCQSIIQQEAESKNGCLLVRNFQSETIPIKDINLIAHVGQWIHYPPKGIRKLISMFWINQNGESISEYYTEEELKTNEWNKIIYNKTINNNNIEFINAKGKRRLKVELKN